MILFGLRSPMVVDYEISAERLGRAVTYGMPASGHPRVLSDIKIVEFSDLGNWVRGPALPYTFSPKKREELAQLAQEMGFDLAEALIDPTAILSPRPRIGAGSFINAGVVVGGAPMVTSAFRSSGRRLRR